MRWEPLEGVAIPEGDVVLWRYMRFDKYAWLLAKSSVWFSRSDKLGDPFEGSRTPLDLRPGQEPHVDHLATIARSVTHLSYVSCWSMSSGGSMGLWKTFTGDAPGVAITTTVKKLRAALEPVDDPLNAGAVRYIDYRKERTADRPSRTRLFHKRRSFEHEHEFRVILHPAWRFKAIPEYWLHSGMPPEANPHGDVPNPDTLPTGIAVPINLESIIDQAFVSPVSPAWYRETVEAVTTELGLQFPVLQSDLDSPAVF